MVRRNVPNGPTPVESYQHPEKRVNIPTADAAAEWVDEADLEMPPLCYVRNVALDPQLVWRGKDAENAGGLVVDAPPLYTQEKIDPRVLVENLRKTAADGETEPEVTLFDDFDGLDELAAVEFYQHEMNWHNRMILGDSLQVMGSLAEREQLRGKVQMIYIDPPYGIKFGSNWQVSARKRDVRDGKIEDAAREAEQIKAFRDTWADGINTYLSYLRDRLTVAHDLLTESGSVFVQIGDENVHLVRSLLDEVFGRENFVSEIAFTKTSSQTSEFLAPVFDRILWFAKDRASAKYRPAFVPKNAAEMTGTYRKVESGDGVLRNITLEEKRTGRVGGRLLALGDMVSQSGSGATQQPFEWGGHTYRPRSGGWKTNSKGLERLAQARRLANAGTTLLYRRYFNDFPVASIGNFWADTQLGGYLKSEEKLYVVQTATSAIERCMLMTTDPGDLVLDPTCGSGTTAYVAEQWGRRWITIDTSRVALALARQRLMSGKYPYYLLADSQEGRKQEGITSGIPLPPAETHGDIRHGFVYERVQHITLKSIANNPDIREGMTREQIDAAIKRHAEFELLYDKPYEDKKRVRVTGPFTVESLSPYRSLSFGDPSTGSGAGPGSGTGSGAGTDAASEGDDGKFTQTILDSLRASGIQNGRRQERIEFASLDAHAGIYVQAVGEAAGGAEQELVAIAIGPEYGTVSPGFVKSAAKEALGIPGVTLLYVLGFSFDPQATGMREVEGQAIDVLDGVASVEGQRKLGRLTVQFARMNAELLMGDALKKTGAGNLFTVFGEPDITVRQAQGPTTDTSQLEVELHGVDVYDPTTGEVRSRQTDRVALWMIDTDYDDESFFVRHCYFTGGGDPMKKLARALKADIDADAWSALYRTTSLPFARPSSGRIAVKVINDYGDEVMKVIDVG